MIELEQFADQNIASDRKHRKRKNKRKDQEARYNLLQVEGPYNQEQFKTEHQMNSTDSGSLNSRGSLQKSDGDIPNDRQQPNLEF